MRIMACQPSFRMTSSSHLSRTTRRMSFPYSVEKLTPSALSCFPLEAPLPLIPAPRAPVGHPRLSVQQAILRKVLQIIPPLQMLTLAWSRNSTHSMEISKPKFRMLIETEICLAGWQWLLTLLFQPGPHLFVPRYLRLNLKLLKYPTYTVKNTSAGLNLTSRLSLSHNRRHSIYSSSSNRKLCTNKRNFTKNSWLSKRGKG